MQENFLPFSDGWIYIRHAGLDQDRPGLLFLPGLGDSGLCFKEVFDYPELQKYSLVVADLPGYGRSAPAANQDYSLHAQVKRLWDVVDHLGLESVHVIGHSVGGDLGALLADSDGENQIKSLVSLEGNLIPQPDFFWHQAAAASEAGRFAEWFEEDFKETRVLKDWGSRWASCRRYYASLQFCRPEAFLASAREISQRSQALPGETASELGKIYANLKIPKLYCWGQESLASAVQAHLKSAVLENHAFADAGHWLMIDQAKVFYPFLAQFLGALNP